MSFNTAKVRSTFKRLLLRLWEQNGNESVVFLACWRSVGAYFRCDHTKQAVVYDVLRVNKPGLDYLLLGICPVPLCLVQLWSIP